MLDREASLRRARAEASLSNSISWGMGEDAIEEAEMLKEILAINLSPRGGDYARVGRALAFYEVGDKEEAFAEMEDVSISLKGYPDAILEFKFIRVKLSVSSRDFCLTLISRRSRHYAGTRLDARTNKRFIHSLLVSLSAFAFLFSELVQYNQTRVDNIAELERRLEDTGYAIGVYLIIWFCIL
ncbi:hypothetical protein GOBAR_DD09727 [Gossypium barbadense]|nr:hypothetical protein GOBAR_DD09727 [Gossypium barbadense]